MPHAGATIDSAVSPLLRDPSAEHLNDILRSPRGWREGREISFLVQCLIKPTGEAPSVWMSCQALLQGPFPAGAGKGAVPVKALLQGKTRVATAGALRVCVLQQQ